MPTFDDAGEMTGFSPGATGGFSFVGEGLSVLEGGTLVVEFHFPGGSQQLQVEMLRDPNDASSVTAFFADALPMVEAGAVSYEVVSIADKFGREVEIGTRFFGGEFQVQQSALDGCQ